MTPVSPRSHGGGQCTVSPRARVLVRRLLLHPLQPGTHRFEESIRRVIRKQAVRHRCGIVHAKAVPIETKLPPGNHPRPPNPDRIAPTVRMDDDHSRRTYPENAACSRETSGPGGTTLVLLGIRTPDWPETENRGLGSADVNTQSSIYRSPHGDLDRPTPLCPLLRPFGPPERAEHLVLVDPDAHPLYRPILQCLSIGPHRADPERCDKLSALLTRMFRPM